MTSNVIHSGDLLDALKDLALEVSAHVLTLRQRGVTSTLKSDQSLVTNADGAAEEIIKDALAKLTPEIPVIAEESVHRGNIPQQNGTYWLVDPIDGTQDYVKGGSHFAIHIGLIDARRAILGVVSLPALAQLYHARRGLGAWRVDQTGEERLVCASDPKGALRVVASRNCLNRPDFLSWQKQQPIAHTEFYGSSIKFMQVAEGRADIYPRFTPSMEWDTAAPQVIVEEAGGVIQDLNGHELTYGKSDWLNPGFICGTPVAVDRIRWG